MAYTKLRFKYLILVISLFMVGCAGNPPKDINNMCSIFEERRSWYKAAKKTQKRWGVPVYVTMAFIHQESKFHGKAKPPRSRILWIFPGPRPSTAYGYAQALKSTWRNYQKEVGKPFADRDDFDDAVDFIGWYNHKSYKRNKIKTDDAYSLYLAYHEGHGGFARRTFKNKKWLIDVSRKVQRRARQYQKQYWGCHKQLEKGFFSRLFSSFYFLYRVRL